MNNFFITILILLLSKKSSMKYIEGQLKTLENWAFLTRFCFLSKEGQFEYFLEFNEDQGVPNLLFYYDTDDQWPAVYKTSKSCYEKEAVLHTEQKQIINLTATNPFFKELSRCTYLTPQLNLSYTHSTKSTTKPATKLTTTKMPFKTPKSEWDDMQISEFSTDSTTTTSIDSLSTQTLLFNEDGRTTRNYKSEFESIFSSSREKEATTPLSEVNRKAPIKKRSLPLKEKVGSKNRTVLCHNVMRFRSARERWWFIAVSNCNGSKGIDIKYNILMTNGLPGDYWHEHFSADEFYILPILLAFSIAYSLLILGVIICTIELKTRQLLHSTYKIFVFSALFQLFGIIISCAAYLKYAVNGVGPSKVRRFGSILMGTSETLYLLLLLLLAKGYTITRGRLRLGSSVKLTIFLCLYAITYISIFIYEANVFDPGEVLYLYESPAGYALISLRIVAWFMFIYATIFTLKHYPEKSNFYYPFNICGTLWLIAGPAFILSANTYIDKWVRESVVCAVLQFITFGGHLTFLVLTMPSVANKNFPYHVRTSQIGIMELTNGINGVSTIEQFGHHNYEPSSTTIEQTIVVPLTRRTEEIYEGMYSHDMQGGIRRASIREMNHQNLAIDNVLNWSLAKNTSALEVPNFERDRRSSFASTASPSSEIETTISRSNLENVSNRHFDDYIRDVPFELFTVSKMIAIPKHVENKEDN